MANHGDTFTVLGNLASQDEKSEAADIIRTSTQIMFSRLGAKNAFDIVVPSQCQEALLDTIRLPDWRYLLLKLKLRLSDEGWQTLLNLTQLGRSLVS